MALRVLIADDSLSMRLLLQRVLTSRGHQVYEAVDGDQALELLHAHHPDVAILDVIMPGLDGLAVCRAARADPDFASLKIIVISANATVDDALTAGADCFLMKPFLPSRLLTVIDELTTVKSV
jgi:CheY-like chemotaxis protein